MPKHRRGTVRKAGWGNALLSWELMRVSRRIGSLALWRFVFGAALLGMMWMLWSAQYAQLEYTSGDASVIQQQLSKFASEFSLTFFVVQLTLVLLLTPIYVAGSVFEERETRSGEVLLTTDLTRAEIFYGKFLARVAQVILVVAAGMPILSLTLLWGGVSIGFVLMGYGVTLVSIFSAGAIAASVASGSETLRAAILKAYAYIFMFDVVLFPASPYLVLLLSRELWLSGLFCSSLFVLIRFITVILSLGYGLRWLRMAMLRQRRRTTDLVRVEMRERRYIRPGVNAFWWKERYVGTNSKLVSDVTMWASLAVFVPVILGVISGVDRSTLWLAQTLVPLMVLLVCFIVGIGTASSVAVERQKNTLIDLFMIPGSRVAILNAKLAGSFWRSRFAGLLLIGSLMLTAINGTPVVAIPLLAITCVVFLWVSATFGMWLSVRCRTAWNANATWVATVVLGLWGGGILVQAYTTTGPRFTADGVRIEREVPAFASVVHPAYLWTDLTLHEAGWIDNRITRSSFVLLPGSTPNILPACAGLLLYALLGAFFWFDARRCFEREGRR